MEVFVILDDLKYNELLWVSGQNFDSVLESVQSSVQCLSLFSNSLRLSQLLGEGFIFVDLSIQLELQSFLRCLDQEVANCLGN